MFGYAGKLLRVDLNSATISPEALDEVTLREYLGGTSLGAKILYEEVRPGVSWDDARNRLIVATGPLTGTRVMGSGTFSVVAKGCLTNGATSTQANGFLGAYMKFSGFDGVIVQGKSDRLLYLYLHDGIAELRDASRLKGKGTRETEALIKEELGAGALSVFSIGPAGENLVKFAGIFGDYGHSASHNGVGAIMGSKGLKAVVAARGRGQIAVADKARLAELVEQNFERIKRQPELRRNYEWGTSTLYIPYEKRGLLPVKNYTTNSFPGCEKFDGPYYRRRYELKPHRCWSCRMNHSHILRVTEGPYTGYEGKEPEYAQWAAWSSQIGQTDPGAAVVLSNEANELGMDCNEASWLIGLLMECYEKGIITKKDTDGIEMTWGNTEAVRLMLRSIAGREGFGGVLAEGVRAAAKAMGKEALECAIYTEKGNTPRAHDDRTDWKRMLDHCTSNTGTSETLGAPRAKPSRPILPEIVPPLSMSGGAEIAPTGSPFSLGAVIGDLARDKGVVQLQDSLVACYFCLPDRLGTVAEMVEAVTGWDFSEEEALRVGLRAVNIMKAFNLRNGLDASLDAPSRRYGSAPKEGPAAGVSAVSVWPKMLRMYYERMGWDGQSGKPKPETLRNLGLEHLIGDIWGKEDNLLIAR